jgi:two-component system, NtrC family, response regulator GlrR
MDTPCFIGRSIAHLQLLEKLAKIAPTDVEVLITGPTGVGKELYARFVHSQSARRQGPFVPVNCGALPNELMENELFGHVGGAFTGARSHSEGLVTEAENGTLFLDEIDSLSPSSQVKLLRFLQDKEYRRLGETRVRRSDVRVIAATNENLVTAMAEGKFRDDLFFRLRVIPIQVPPLRERREDIPLLLNGYVAHYAETYRLPEVVFSEAAAHSLEEYPWPGNIRELENYVRYLTCLQLNRPVQPEDLPLLNNEEDSNGEAGQQTLTERTFREAKREIVNGFERAYLEDALRQSGGNISRAARASGKPRRVFFELMRKHGVRASDFVPRVIDSEALTSH